MSVVKLKPQPSKAPPKLPVILRGQYLTDDDKKLWRVTRLGASTVEVEDVLDGSLHPMSRATAEKLRTVTPTAPGAA